MSLLDTAHEIWAAAQLLPGEGIVDGVGRVESLLSQCRKETRKEALLEAAEVCEAKADAHGWNYDLPSVGRELGAEFRRMAESDKTTMEGEKHE